VLARGGSGARSPSITVQKDSLAMSWAEEKTWELCGLAFVAVMETSDAGWLYHLARFGRLGQSWPRGVFLQGKMSSRLMIVLSSFSACVANAFPRERSNDQDILA